jgi:hypothetical protein
VGTNGAFGGSGAAAWAKVRDEWSAMGTTSGSAGGSGGETGAGPDDGGETSDPDAAYGALVSSLADALIREDPDARRKSVPKVPFSSTLPGHGGQGRGGRAGGGSGGASGGGRSAAGGRRITGQSARGGNAIGAATAYRERDGATLAGFGLTLEELDGLSPRMRYSRILDVAIGQAGHPDEQAMRQASLEQIKALLAQGTDLGVITGLEAIRNFVGELTVRLGLIELTDQVLTKTLTAKEAHKRETGLRQWVKAKVGRLDLGKYGEVSTRDFHQAARQMSADVLRLLKGE